MVIGSFLCLENAPIASLVLEHGFVYSWTVVSALFGPPSMATQVVVRKDRTPQGATWSLKKYIKGKPGVEESQASYGCQTVIGMQRGVGVF